MDNTNAIQNKTDFLMYQIIIAIIAALIMMFSWAGNALAEDTATTISNPSLTISTDLSNENKVLKSELKVKGKYSVKSLAGYQELLKLRTEAQTVIREIAHNHTGVVQAIVSAKHDNKDVSAIVKTYREDQKKHHNQLKSLWQTQKTYWAAMRTARHAKDKAKMDEAMKQILTGRRLINDQLIQIRDDQDKFIVDVKNAPV
ncbi:MAG: hypothetical protein ACM3QW_01420, partial [Ignavibacteriales bacterium]